MDYKLIIAGIIIIAIAFYFYYKYKIINAIIPKLPSNLHPVSSPVPKISGKGPVETLRNNTGNIYGDNYRWNESLLVTIDPKIKQHHKDYVENVTRFGGSTVRNFDIEETATNPMFTNFVGLRRPQYIPIRATNREIPDIDVTPMKTFKRYLI